MTITDIICTHLFQIIFAPVFIASFFVSCSVTSDVCSKVHNLWSQRGIRQTLGASGGSSGSGSTASTTTGTTTTPTPTTTTTPEASTPQERLDKLEQANRDLYTWRSIASKAQSETRRNFFGTYIVDVSVWPPLQAINFTYVPLRFQLLYINSLMVFWNIFLSHMANS
jgi:hypothetical protein